MSSDLSGQGLLSLAALPSDASLLNLRDNKLCMLDSFSSWSGKSTCRRLNLANNRVVVLTPLNVLTSLDDLDLSDNFVTEKTLPALLPAVPLRSLNLSGNTLQSFALRDGFIHLQVLQLSNNHLETWVSICMLYISRIRAPT
jgi:hypothetical protein